MTIAPKILVIDDDSDIGELVSAAAQTMSLSCTATTDVEAFLEILTPDTTLIMLDLMMPEMDGVELLRLLGEKKCKAGIVLMSGIGKRVIETAEELALAHGLSVVGHLRKPFRFAELEQVLRNHREQEAVERKAVPIFKHQPQMAIQDSEIQSAVERDEFVLYYQPQIDIASGKVIGVEGLVRWRHSKYGLIYPDHFIGRAEALGLIDQLGWIVANRGLSEVAQLADKDGVVPVLSLNVSVYSLLDLKFPDTFASLAGKYRVPTKNVILEITESGLLKELSRTLDVLTRLRMKGVQLSIDDFGTGYAMMQQLRHVPATELKIDKSFVQNMYINDSNRVLVQKTIEIGHELGMKVVAEGVDTLEQLDFLRSNGCDVAQGHLFSRPLPTRELLVWLEEYRSRKTP